MGFRYFRKPIIFYVEDLYLVNSINSKTNAKTDVLTMKERVSPMMAF